MTDAFGTVRRSLDGAHHAFKRDVSEPHVWIVHPEFKVDKVTSYLHLTDTQVAGWEIVYRPPLPPQPVGTVLRRELKRAYSTGWEIAIHTQAGWFVVDEDGDWWDDEPAPTQPEDDDEGTWTIIYTVQ